MKPFLKWAGGKRWLMERADFSLPNFSGRYIEPFVGGGAAFFHIRPRRAIIADINERLIETYKSIAADAEGVKRSLRQYQSSHCAEFYYQERSRKRRSPSARAAQFLYLNRTCWNGLYRENLRGEFNVPIGTKSTVFHEGEDFAAIAATLARAEILCQSFEETIAMAKKNDLVFVDPPYTTAHNLNGFVKYNQRIFSWDDQIKLRDEAMLAKERGAQVVVTNANHSSIVDLYRDATEISVIDRRTVISGKNAGRKPTAELLIRL